MRNLFDQIDRRWTRICTQTYSDRCHFFQGIDNGSEGELSDGDNHELSIGKLVSSVASDGGDSENEDNLAIREADGRALIAIGCRKSEYEIMLITGETTPTNSCFRITLISCHQQRQSKMCKYRKQLLEFRIGAHIVIMASLQHQRARHSSHRAAAYACRHGHFLVCGCFDRSCYCQGRQSCVHSTERLTHGQV